MSILNMMGRQSGRGQYATTKYRSRGGSVRSRAKRGGAVLPSPQECRTLLRRKQLSGRKPAKYSLCKWLRSRDYLDFKNEGRSPRDYGLLSFMSAARRTARHGRNKLKKSMKREAALFGDAAHGDDIITDKQLKSKVKDGVYTPQQAARLENQPAKMRWMSMLKWPESDVRAEQNLSALNAEIEQELREPTKISAAAQRKGHLARLEAEHMAERAQRHMTR